MKSEFFLYVCYFQVVLGESSRIVRRVQPLPLSQMRTTIVRLRLRVQSWIVGGTIVQDFLDVAEENRMFRDLKEGVPILGARRQPHPFDEET